MTSPNDNKAFLQLCLTKRLLDKAQAKDIWQQARQSGQTPQVILVQQNLMAQHTVNALEKELRQAQEPRVIAGFSIVNPLGQGGMATVYLAKQISLGRDVALKLMSPQIAANPEAAERFLREARVAATVNHPNVVSIIDVGHADGQLYMALELVNGGDAAQLAQRFGGVLPEARALELLIDCAKGLQALYEARLVHRDLKPSNIFITKDGSAKLGDLGLARSEDGADRLTVTGHLVGTPAFMSPEQAGGEGTVDIRSDIYALGATLFALVTGRQPFTGNSPIAVAAKALTEPAPDPRSLVPALSAATATLILRTMAKAQHERFQTPQELREALQQALAHVPHADATPSMKISGTLRPRDPATPVTIVGAKRAPSRAPRQRRAQPTWTLLILAVLVVLTAAGLWVMGANKRTASEAAPVSQTPPKAPVIAAPTATSMPATPARPESPTPIPAKPIEHATRSVPPSGVNASPPPGPDPAPTPWAAEHGKDAFGYWITITINGAHQRLRWLPPGTATIGSPPQEPGRNNLEDESRVTFTYGIWMSDTECTQKFWQAVMGTNPSPTVNPQMPVHHVAMTEAFTFTHVLGQKIGPVHVRIPSRAEWERACRAGATTAYSTGNDPESLAGFANLHDQDRGNTNVQRQVVTFSDGFVDLAPVASLRPNRWGFYDMHGNVAEYCVATFETLPKECVDPQTADSLPQWAYLRGGAYDTEDRAAVRCAAMPFVLIDSHNDDLGFRFLIEAPR